MPSRTKLILLFALLFLFRLGFGLLESKWSGEDQLQTYLIGLKCYTTGTWPYFGPDVNGIENQTVQNQIPGALEGLLIGLPFYVFPIPEAPYIFLNLMSTAGAFLLARYIQKRIPTLSFPLLFLWISICPWSLHEGTTILNPPFNFLPSVLFFIGFLETLPALSQKLLKPFWANALMGFSVFWTMQFHFSFVYLLPLTAYSFWIQFNNPAGTLGMKKPIGIDRSLSASKAFISGFKKFRFLLYFVAGAAPMLVLIIPTYLKYGLFRGNVASGFGVPFNPGNALEIHTILARFLSLACFEMPRFIGQHNSERFQFLLQNPAILVPGAVLWIGGILQAVFLFLAWFKTSSPFPQWNPLKKVLAGAFLMVYASFWFTVKLPMSHIYFILFPLIMIYSCYVWSYFADNPRWGFAVRLWLILAVGFQAGYAVAKAPQDSLYTQREVVAKALREKNYRLLGERRAGSLY